MAEPADQEPDPLVTWGLASFHVAALTLLGVALLRTGDALGVLADLGTSVGLALYLLLWATTWATNRTLRSRADLGGSRRLLAREAALWGAVTGAAFLLELAAVVAVLAVAADGLSPVSELLPLVAVLGVATVAALAVGAVVGLVLAGADRLALRAAAVLAPETVDDSGTPLERPPDG